jgi:hypothetical protein
MGKFMTHGAIVLTATLTAALAVSGTNPVESGAAEQAGSGRLSEVAAPEVPSNATQFDALHQTKVREYFSNHKAALVPPVEADNASIKVGVLGVGASLSAPGRNLHRHADDARLSLFPLG